MLLSTNNMKFSLFKKKNSAETTRMLSSQGGIFHRIGRDALLDWTWILSLGVIITLAGLFWGYVAYRSTHEKLSATSPVGGSPVSRIFNVNALDLVVRDFDDRAAEREALKKGYNGPTDPSL
jgi:hypothetical protein